MHNLCYSLVHVKNKCVCACLQTPPNNLIIYATEERLDRSINELCDYLFNKKLQIHGIIGPKETVVKFNEIWTSINTVSAKIEMNEMVYKLEKVNHPPLSEGKLRQAVYSDLELISGWMKNFIVRH